ncbi:MAG: urease accessory protein UreF [Pseudomonadota bacterium]
MARYTATTILISRMPPTITTITVMADTAALFRLLTWFSPSYPVGAYTYSHGLEHAVEIGQVTEAATTEAWITDIITLGAGYSDTVFVLEALREAKVGDVKAVAEFAANFTVTRELTLESHAQGRAFLGVSRASWPTPTLDTLIEQWQGPYAFPIVVGCLCAGHDIDEEQAALAYLHGMAANLVSAAVRLVPLGQTDGQRITAALQAPIDETVRRALVCPYDQATNTSLLTDICSMRHETQHTRLFRS